MDLKEFIKTALVDIVQGIDEAKKEIDNNQKAQICPILAPVSTAKFNIQVDVNGMYYQQAEFDIAVTAESKSDTGAKAGIKVFGIDASMGGNVSGNSSTVSRIKFHVPLGLPSKRDMA